MWKGRIMSKKDGKCFFTTRHAGFQRLCKYCKRPAQHYFGKDPEKLKQVRATWEEPCQKLLEEQKEKGKVMGQRRIREDASTFRTTYYLYSENGSLVWKFIHYNENDPDWAGQWFVGRGHKPIYLPLPNAQNVPHRKSESYCRQFMRDWIK